MHETRTPAERASISKLALVTYGLNRILALRDDPIPIARVRAEIAAGTIFAFLEERFDLTHDFSVFDAAERAALIAEWAEYGPHPAYRLTGIDDGIALLVAYLLQGIQHRHVALVAELDRRRLRYHVVRSAAPGDGDRRRLSSYPSVGAAYRALDAIGELLATQGVSADAYAVVDDAEDTVPRPGTH